MDDATKSFLGTGWSFPPSFSSDTASVVMISDEEDIRSSLEILLSTSLGERIMQPNYGCDMTKLLFEPLDTTLQTYMKDLITTAILYYEPRIILNSVLLENDDLASGTIRVIIDYTVTTTNTRYNLVFPFYLKEGTNISQ